MFSQLSNTTGPFFILVFQQSNDKSPAYFKTKTITLHIKIILKKNWLNAYKSLIWETSLPNWFLKLDLKQTVALLQSG